MIVDDYAKTVLEITSNESLGIDDYLVGLRYSIGVIGGGKGHEAGIAITPAEDVLGMPMARPILRPEDLLERVSSMNIIEKSLGIALLNAISQYILWDMEYIEDYHVEQDKGLIDLVLEAIKDHGGEKIVVVGNMVPLVKKIREQNFEPIVLERNPAYRGRQCLPDSSGYRALLNADIVIITGATLVNDTIDIVLRLAEKAHTKILAGPTAAVYPEPFLKRGITHIASTKIIDIRKAYDIIKHGGGRWDLDEYLEDYIVIIK